MPDARHALIAGLGLIGGSIGIALRRGGWRVSFDDPNVSLADARAAGAAEDDERDGADIVITQPMVDEVNDIADRLVAAGSPALGSAINTERAKYNHLQDFAGKTFKQASDILGTSVQRVYLPLIRR